MQDETNKDNQQNNTAETEIKQSNTSEIDAQQGTSTETEMPEQEEHVVSRKKVFIPVGIVAFIIVIAVCLYLGGAFYYSHRFLPGTTIGDLDVAGMTVQDAEDLIRKDTAQYVLTLTGREGMTETIKGTEISIEPVLNGQVSAFMAGQNRFTWIFKYGKPDSFSLSQAVSFDEEKLASAVNGLDCMQPANERKPVDATRTDYVDGVGYSLIPADYGTTLVQDAVYEAVAETILSLSDTLDLDEAGCYLEPAVGDDDAALLSLIDNLNHYACMTITYDFDDEREVLDGSAIHEWLSVDSKGNVVVDADAPMDFVKSLAKKYNTAYQAKELETSYDITVTITGGFYGWRIDNEAEYEQLMADLEAGVDVEREPVYMQTANSHGEHDYGDSYVEINLTAQHLFLYKDGECVLDTNFVSGNVANGHDTPTGAFSITYKTTDAVLRGEDYETPVKYWMPFNGDVGMHDATWRSSFGGTIYKTNGSHGCINLPYSAAQSIYEVVEQGYAVLVYKLPGTESTAVQQSEAAAVVSAINTIGPVTLESETAIATARNLYNDLPSSATQYVTNYDVLLAAEAELAALQNPAIEETPTDTESTAESAAEPITETTE